MRVGEHEAAIHALLARASSIRCVQVLCTVAEDVRRAREPVRHAGHLDAITSFSSAAGAFLDIPSIRLEIDGSESSQARERLFAVLDVSLQHST